MARHRHAWSAPAAVLRTYSFDASAEDGGPERWTAPVQYDDGTCLTRQACTVARCRVYRTRIRRPFSITRDGTPVFTMPPRRRHG